MNALDIVILLILATATIFGLLRGFVRIAIGVGGLAISLALALRLAERGPAWFEGVFVSPHTARLVVFALVLVAGLIVAALAALLARKLVQAAEIGWIDRLIGGAVGFAGSALFVMGLLAGLLTFLPARSELLTQSRTLTRAIGVVDAAASILPPKMAEAYHAKRDALRTLPAGAPAATPGKRS